MRHGKGIRGVRVLVWQYVEEEEHTSLVFPLSGPLKSQKGSGLVGPTRAWSVTGGPLQWSWSALQILFASSLFFFLDWVGLGRLTLWTGLIACLL